MDTTCVIAFTRNCDVMLTLTIRSISISLPSRNDNKDISPALLTNISTGPMSFSIFNFSVAI